MLALQLSRSSAASLLILALWGCSSGDLPQASSTIGSSGDKGGASSVSSAVSGSGGASEGTTSSEGSGEGGARGGSGGGAGSSFVAQLALGARHSCARLSTGELYCWGYDGLRGALGSGTAIETSPVALQVKDATGAGTLAGVTDVAAGYDHTCAITSDGKLVCFGFNINGQLGNDSGTSSSVPVAVKGVGGVGELSGVTKVACGSYVTCALAGTGVYCWGQNNLGDGTQVGSQVPVQVLDAEGTGPFTDAVEVGVGDQHVCIRKSDKTLHCFGNNKNGQLGIGSTTKKTLPVQVEAPAGQPGFLSGVEAITRLGASHSCARLGGAVACWGDGGLGELGASAPETCTDPCARVPLLVPGIAALNPAVEITSGAEHTCARLADNSVVCWGANTSSQLGAVVSSPCPPGNPGSCSAEPVTVMTPAHVPFSATQVASGSGDHTCAIAPDGGVWCWGDNTYGQLGDGTSASSVYPVRVVGL